MQSAVDNINISQFNSLYSNRIGGPGVKGASASNCYKGIKFVLLAVNNKVAKAKCVASNLHVYLYFI